MALGLHKKIMKWIAIISRILLGLLYLFSIINFFFQLGEMPSLSENAAKFSSAMMNSGFMIVVKIIETIGALLLISGQYLRFATLWILPVTVNIFLFHVLMMQSGVAIPIGMLLINIFLLYYYRDDLRVILKRI